MFGSRPTRALAVVAHADDLELMAGGTVARLVGEGHSVHVVSITDGVWTSPDGAVLREREAALSEERDSAALLGYSVENLGRPAMDLEFDDELVVEVLRRADALDANLLLCPWERDLVHDHEVASRIAVAASRRIPVVLLGQINHHLREVFAPNVFVDITSVWEQKIDALKCFRTEWARAGEDWYGFLDATSRYYGRMVGVERAEGFVSPKFLV
jgi:LmbE family N-acetylglucosaminyl deacetylase